MNLKMSFKNRLQHLSRFQSIVRVAAKHGFAGLFLEMGFTGPSDKSASNLKEISAAKRLRLTFEELGPTFIKFGQILSTRPDLLPPDFIEEFEKLTDRIPSFAFSEVEKILEAELSQSPYEIFESIEAEPIAAASIAQVHRARLFEGEIRDVVIKVQRPNIVENIQSDIQILFFLARSLEKLRDEFKLFNLTGMVREFQRTIHEELDFSLEAKNLEDISKNVQGFEAVILPEVIWACSTKKVITLSEIKGKALSQMKVFPDNVDRAYLAESLALFFMQSIFFHGVFHCDAHAGNILVIPEGRGAVGLVDFGMVGRIGPDLRDKLGRIFLALVNRDFASLGSLYTEIATFGAKFSMREFKSDLERLLGPNLSRPLKEVDVSKMMLDSIQIARKYQVQLPRDLILFYRAAVTLEHVGRVIDPDFTFLNVGSRFGKQLIQSRLSVENVSRDLFRFIESLRSLGTEFPGQLKTIMNKIEADELFPQSSVFSEGFRKFQKSNQLLATSIVSFGLLLSASILSNNPGNESLSLALWIGAGLSILMMLVQGLRR